MHKEKIIVDGQEIEVDTFDTKVHVNKGIKHALNDIERLLKEDKLNKQLGSE